MQQALFIVIWKIWIDKSVQIWALCREESILSKEKLFIVEKIFLTGNARPLCLSHKVKKVVKNKTKK